ncbi:hypothetical protein Tco_0928758 [Tanacetum coccineum]
MTTPNNNSQMHNDIMAAGSKDRPPMLATGRYAHKAATKTDPDVPEHTIQETYENKSPKIHACIDAQAETIHMILSESLNKQDVKTDIFWVFGKLTSRDEESIESYYSRFYKMMNEMVRNQLEVATMQVNVQFLQQLQPEWSRFVMAVKQIVDLDKESYHKLFDILKQYQNKVNEICAEKIVRIANPLALVAAAQQYPNDNYYRAPKLHKDQTISYRHTSSTNNDPKQAQRDKDMQKSITFSAKYFTKTYKTTNNNLKTSLNSRNKNVDSTSRTENERQTRQYGNQRTVTVVGARETVGNQVVPQTVIQCFNCKEYGIDEYAYSVILMVLIWDRMSTPTQCWLWYHGIGWVSILRKVKLGSLASETVGLHAEFIS